jgi:acyl-CoA synthetase (AMP-forming)/AMP-acid ligase II
VTSFYETARQDPDREAVVDPDGTTLTFGELGARVNRLSRAFRSLGQRKRDVVAKAVRNGHEFPELILAPSQTGMYPAEVEEQLLAHPAVDDVAVIGVPHPDWGKAVVAVVQPASNTPGDAVLAKTLLEHCRGTLHDVTANQPEASFAASA